MRKGQWRYAARANIPGLNGLAGLHATAELIETDAFEKNVTLHNHWVFKLKKLHNVCNSECLGLWCYLTVTKFIKSTMTVIIIIIKKHLFQSPEDRTQKVPQMQAIRRIAPTRRKFLKQLCKPKYVLYNKLF